MIHCSLINAGFVVWRITSIPYIVKIVLVTVLVLHQIYNNFQRIAVTP